MTKLNANQNKVAVIGAGLAGLSAARALSDHGLDVTVFEKSRGLGGRMSTRRTDEFGQFDHGAQYFTARDPRFRKYVNEWQQLGVVARWPAPKSNQKIAVIKNGTLKSESNSQERFVATPAMNSIAKHLASDLNVVLQTRIAKIKPVAGGHELRDDNDDARGSFAAVVTSAPAEQTCELLTNYRSLKSEVERIEMRPCWATMVSLERPLTANWVGAFIHDSFLSWVARNSTKPKRTNNRSKNENLVLHAQPNWTAEHWEDDPESVASLMMQEFWRASDTKPVPVIYKKSHRWKYALAKEPASNECFFDEQLQIGACGDWANGSRVEGAFLSGMAIAGRLLGTLNQ